MKEIKLYSCHCGGEMKIEKVAQNGGMDGTYWDWELTCNKCGLTKTYAADDFYGRKYKTFEEVVNDWNWNRKKEKIIKADVLDKLRAEIENIAFDWQEIDGEHESHMVVDLNDALNIIDKHKTESEVQDADSN